MFRKVRGKCSLKEESRVEGEVGLRKILIRIHGNCTGLFLKNEIVKTTVQK